MSRWLANVLSLGLKELAGLAGDGVLAAFLIYSFSLSVYDHATGVNTNVNNARVAIVDSDHSTLSAQIGEALLPPYFRQASFLDRSEVDSEMDHGNYAFVLDIPPHFEADVLRARNPSLQLNVDATAMTQAGIGSSYIETIASQETQRFLKSRGLENDLPVRISDRAFFNPNLESLWFEAIMAVVQNVTMLTILVAGAAVIREREHGTIEHLLVMPVRPSEIALAKIWANGLAILIGTAFSLVFVVHLTLGVPIPGSIPLFLVGSAAYLFAVASLGILLGTVARTMPQFALLAIPTMLVLMMLSGAMTPLESMPQILQVLTEASPAVHFVKLSQSVLFRGAGLAIIWPQLLVLGLLGGVFLAVALARFRSMLARA